MKIGVRKPSIKKSVSARTTGRVKRKVKRLTNPFYGKKGMGAIKNPKKAIYNKVYNKSTVSTKKTIGCIGACMWYLIYGCFALMWWMLKYVFIGIWWLCVLMINGCITLYEWIINRNAEDVTTNDVNF